MIKVSSVVKMNMPKIKQLDGAAVKALEQTAEALHTEVIQAQVVPRRDGTLQGEGFFVDYSESSTGKVTLVHATPYARRLYYHPEYKFHRGPWMEYVAEKDGKKRSFDSDKEAKEWAGEGKVRVLKHDGNANAKGKWFEDWISGSKNKQIKNMYKELYRRLAGI